ncbi:IS30 family transposase [Streptococcus agalactiae]|uniref:IS30 family transposase n=1 Tax=Streptococcus agalactiae TaxID=1311 RepID=UPI003644D538
MEGESASRVFKTITADNGLEFASLDELNAYFTAYYAHPCSSWERGTNEKQKGILRRFIGKDQSFKDLTQESLAHITDMMNNLPKKVLGYRKPEEVFEGECYI